MDSYINKDFLYCVVGATSSPQAEGNRVLNTIKDKGYKVFGVSPYSEEINGIKCFESVLDFEDRPDVIIVTTSPYESRPIVEDCIDFGLDVIWFQPNCCNLDFFMELEQKHADVICDRDICLEL